VPAFICIDLLISCALKINDDDDDDDELSLVTYRSCSYSLQVTSGYCNGLQTTLVSPLRSSTPAEYFRRQQPCESETNGYLGNGFSGVSTNSTTASGQTVNYYFASTA